MATVTPAGCPPPTTGPAMSTGTARPPVILLADRDARVCKVPQMRWMEEMGRRSGSMIRCGGRLAVAFIGIALLASCGGGSSHAGATDAGNDAGTLDGGTSFPTTMTQSGTVQLPAGVTVPLQSLTVQGSLDNVAVSSSGAFSITTYSPGAQLVAVLSPSGNPMLMGWLDASHTTIDAESTAEVLLWFGAGIPNLPADARQTALAALATTPALDGVTQAIETGLVASPDTFANPNQPLTDALTQVLAPIRQGMPGTILDIADVLVQPGASSPQSGLSVIQDPPYSAHVTNAFRRRAWAFVQRVSETTGTTVTPDPMDITDFEVTPILGLNQGLNGTVANIMNVYYGTATAIGAPVNSPRDMSTNMTLPFSVPLVGNADKTTYTVTVVGAGLLTGAALPLTAAQIAKITDIGVRSFVVDAFLPVLTNVIFGIPGLIPNSTFLDNLAKNLSKDLLNSFPKLGPSIVSGDWNSVFATLNQSFGAPSSTWRGLVVDDITLAIQQTPGGAGLSYKAAGAVNLVKTINTYITISGLVLQAVDSRWFISSIAQSDQADAWTLDVTPSKVTLNPSASTTSVGQMLTLAASVLGVNDLTGYSFEWTNTENGGDLLQVGAGSQTTSVSSPSFCASVTQGASVAQVNYLASTSGVTDTVTVEAFNGPNCAMGTGTSVGTAKAMVTITQPGLINGSFEARVVTQADTCQGGPWCVRSFDSTPGWTQILDGVDLIQNNYSQGTDPQFAVLVQASDGVNWVDMNQAGSLGGLEQVVSATVGATYQLTLDTCAWAGNSIPGTIGYQLYDPGTMSVLANDMYTDSVGGTWITKQIQAAATSNSIGVRIQGLAAHQAGMGLDNVRLIQMP
jgi:hypothetical protein